MGTPDTLKRSIAAAGDSIQPTYGWNRDQWVAAAPEIVRPLLADRDCVPDLLDRSAIIHLCAAISDSKSTMLAFVATMAWGADTRDGRVAPRTGAGLNATHANERLATMVDVARGGDPKRAYRVAKVNAIKGVGPAFATKFLAFCSRAQYPDGPDRQVALIHDSVMSAWLWEEAAVDVFADDWRPRAYDRYLDTMWAWADAEGVSADRIEEIIFRSSVSGGDLNPRAQWPKQWVEAYRAVRRAWAALICADAAAENVSELDALSRRIDESMS